MIPVLLVDDHPAICFALKVLLEKSGEFTVTSSSGENIIARIHHDAPKLLILDLDLRNADGLALLPRIKQHFPALKVLIFTNQPAHVYALRTLQAGADGFLNKSLSLSSVEPLCHLILDGYSCFPGGILNEALRATGDTPHGDEVLERFSDREIAVLNYLRQGKSNKEIAERLALSNKTISTYKARMLQKSGAEDLQQLFALLDGEEEK
ncbi:MULTISPECIES: response regulator transcription factor [Tenebrionibacter/Tenebrionicola group]|uniref:Response regulator transcription factor n=2 Tax=Tenebrionibacter/Tenebrionicola group TaxID=2969848 RepID=A0A8K0V440_9ENTR|nr:MULTISPECIES: response regulator transcription factor [Tenebrionibacter/Tenebrionicola group]MBK4714719.1 response regulator transcription factor [Tenebrionibacter intestinalis]MBV4413875.1 response regulator transcription factor [Tenebrionicola larvae]MBV5095191.1 response regulator transcription factor [Tenebrionicola larvae]